MDLVSVEPKTGGLGTQAVARTESRKMRKSWISLANGSCRVSGAERRDWPGQREGMGPGPERRGLEPWEGASTRALSVGAWPRRSPGV